MDDYSHPFPSAAEEIAGLRKELESIKAENSRLHRLLGVTGSHCCAGPAIPGRLVRRA